MFSSLVGKPRMLVILAGMDQEDSLFFYGSGMCKAGFAGYEAPRAVFSSRFAGPCSASWPFWTERPVAVACVRLVLLVIMHFALCSSLVDRPMMFDIMAAMDQKDSCDIETVESPQLQSFQVVDISFAAQRQSLMVQTVRRTTDIPQLLYTVIDVPVVQVGRVPKVPSWRRQLCSHSCTC